MFETYATVTGRVITEPRRAQTNGHGDVVTFRMACNSRRLDRESGQWSDGPSLFLSVKCWNRLATTVPDAVQRGALIIAHGALYTDEYVGNDGIKRSSLEMKAVSLGLDLAQPGAREKTIEAPRSGGAPIEGEWVGLPN
ncbi:single-stranded DNA-binding protein [Gordonia alkaliphila]|uniref:single-stranded DNA-binding protein n=1 Tax=Gordonia alkaliphila TaxID=1053547 RepID=UPI001FF24FAA|nr:single-stranded DNA-binding protein [Gordonia alkaliphila]MCK0440257.1 single-stranded DNA-binding protein [Gordonia alkaliphila]